MVLEPSSLEGDPARMEGGPSILEGDPSILEGAKRAVKPMLFEGF